MTRLQTLAVRARVTWQVDNDNHKQLGAEAAQAWVGSLLCLLREGSRVRCCACRAATSTELVASRSCASTRARGARRHAFDAAQTRESTVVFDTQRASHYSRLSWRSRSVMSGWF